MIDVTLADRQSRGNLTIFPLVGDGAAPLPYLLLVDALAAGSLRIEEVRGGRVPTLLAVNGAELAILILDGEQLVGAKQNRMTNRSIILPAKSETEIPVSCMEQGRWQFVSNHFSGRDQNAPPRVRRTARDHEKAAMAMGIAADAESLSGAQGDVWMSIRELETDVGEHSDTGALDELQSKRRDEIDELSSAFPAVPGQVGLLALIDMEPVGTDVIGCVELYRSLHPRLLRGYLLDSLAAKARPATSQSPERTARRRGPEPDVGEGAQTGVTGDSAEPPVIRTAERFLAAVRSARRVEAPTVGSGRYSVLTDGVTGAQLEDRDRTAHVSAFPEDGRDREGRGRQIDRLPVARPSRRRRWGMAGDGEV